ncbi:EspA/EspE family type VII secretion system effector [Mycobacterium sp. URHD0025]|uniref:EspA/EspE family type VII secretion system effector n=1 Tax=Mycobacterium sp. URHD0025 TaxID=1298864 RepID=UPI000406485E|nr:EspA/EspE family type VII secretion system effector [Mycobacterium sp. URHD0025]
MESFGDTAASGKHVSDQAGMVTAGSPVLVVGQRVIQKIRLTTGVGEPEDGRRFGDGAQRFRSAGRTLNAAYSGDSWDGAASVAYTGQTTTLVGRTQAMVDADARMASVLSREAEQIAATREGLDRQSEWLGDMSLTTAAAGRFTHAGLAAQTSAEMAMVTKAVGESADQLMALHSDVGVNAAAVRDAVNLYAGIASEAVPDDEDRGSGQQEKSEKSEKSAEDTAADSEQHPVSAPVAEPTVGAQPGPSSPSAAISGNQPAVPSPPAGSSAPTAAPGASPGSDIAGVVAGVIGAILGPLVGVFGGIAQAGGQAAQIASQAAQGGGQTGQPADRIDDDEIAQAAESDDRGTRDTGKEEQSVDEDRGLTRDSGDGDPVVDEPRDAGANDDSAGEGGRGPAMTLPPDLEVASATMIGRASAPQFVLTDLEQGQLRPPVTATLERGIPGSAAVVNR